MVFMRKENIKKTDTNKKMSCKSFLLCLSLSTTLISNSVFASDAQVLRGEDISKGIRSKLSGGNFNAGVEIKKAVEDGKTTWAESFIRFAIELCLKSLEGGGQTAALNNGNEVFSSMIRASAPGSVPEPSSPNKSSPSSPSPKKIIPAQPGPTTPPFKAQSNGSQGGNPPAVDYTKMTLSAEELAQGIALSESVTNGSKQVQSFSSDEQRLYSVLMGNPIYNAQYESTLPKKIPARQQLLLPPGAISPINNTAQGAGGNVGVATKTFHGIDVSCEEEIKNYASTNKLILTEEACAELENISNNFSNELFKSHLKGSIKAARARLNPKVIEDKRTLREKILLAIDSKIKVLDFLENIETILSAFSSEDGKKVIDTDIDDITTKIWEKCDKEQLGVIQLRGKLGLQGAISKEKALLALRNKILEIKKKDTTPLSQDFLNLTVIAPANNSSVTGNTAAIKAQLTNNTNLIIENLAGSQISDTNKLLPLPPPPPPPPHGTIKSPLTPPPPPPPLKKQT